MRLRPYQAQLKADVYAAWQAGARVAMAVSATGSGKTVLFSDMLHEHKGAACAIAHRQELVSQISLALARNGVRHRIIGQKQLQRTCAALHMSELGVNYTDPNARCAAAGVDTLLNLPPSDPWFQQVGLWVGDEGHHFLKENKWGKAVSMFPNARGLLVTATPTRADGRGLGSHADGLADRMVIAPSMRDLISMGYLTDYRVFAPPSDINYEEVPVGASGELVNAKLREAVHRSKTIVGDVVQHYLRIAPGKLGVTFAVDVEAATEIAAAFRAAGVPAEVVSAKTPDQLRASILRRFKNREVLQLVNVDLFGEGFDLPAIEVVSMVRRTESWSLFCQQFGRALRLMIDAEHAKVWDSYTDEQRRAVIAASDKPRALIIDHVGNTLRHGLPDARNTWSLDRRERRSKGAPVDAIPLRTCVNLNANGTGEPCLQPYERTLKCCPHCGHYPEPAARTAPEYVDGDLAELDADTLAKMRGEIARIDSPAPLIPHGAAPEVVGAIKKRHYERQQAQAALRQALQWWGGFHEAHGRDTSEAQRRFWHTFGLDVGTAQTLGTREAGELLGRIAENLAQYNIDVTVNAR